MLNSILQKNNEAIQRKSENVKTSEELDQDASV